MKICTDSCLFGALLPEGFIKEDRALDIGSGTGLLSLMFAQKNTECNIDAVELDEDAFIQSKSNFLNSNWNENIHPLHKSVLDFKPIIKYDIIFCNPPFFTNDLKSSNENRNVAKHSTALTFNELLFKVSELLHENGSFYVLIPFVSEKEFVDIAEIYHLKSSKIIRVKQTLNHNYFRSVICFSRAPLTLELKEICIKNDNEYSNEFKELLKDYYLYL